MDVIAGSEQLSQMTNASEDRSWNPCESIWADQPYADDERFAEWFAGLTEEQQVLFPTHWLNDEVNNGGFHQYFTNSTGYHAPEAIVGFRVLGLRDIAEIVEQAVAVFGPDFPRKRGDREQFLERFEGTERSEWNPFYKIDDAFYEAMKRRDGPESRDDRFTAAAKNYVRKAGT